MKVGESRIVDGLRVTFGSVPEDSRCASDVVCPWAGNAVVLLVAEHTMGEAPGSPLQLNTANQPKSGVIFGVSITLVALRPVPSAGGVIRVDDYRAELLLQGVDTVTP